MEIKEQLEALALELKGKTGAQVETAIKSFKDTLDVEIKGMISKEVLEIESKMKTIQDHADALDMKLQAQKSQSKEVTMTSEIKDNVENFKSFDFIQGGKEIEVKATTIRASVVGNQQAVELSDIGQLAHRQLTAYDLFTKIPVNSTNNNGVIRYYDWDSATTVRAADMVAEGAAFPESTAKWETKTIPLRKVGDTLPVSAEFYEDEAMFAAELGQFLTTNVNIKIDDQIVNGDNTGQNLNGIFNSVGTYTPAASGIDDASIYDLIPKISEDITVIGGSKYAPNFALMNKADINKYKLKKDANNNYIMPPFVSRDGSVIDGVVVVECNAVTANSMVLGDNRYARIYEKTGITLTKGTVADQFVEDMETLKVRKRLLFLIRGADIGGFRKVLDIDAALAVLATV